MIPINSKVKIKSRYDENARPSSYYQIFTRDMLEEYGGKIGKVRYKRLHKCNNSQYLHDDGYDYFLEEMPNFVWRSSMFSEVINSSLPNLF